MSERDDLPAGDGGVKSSFTAWLDNFWYHYKWHTIAIVFIIAVVVICTLQMCDRTEMDINILYAGNDDISMTRDGEELSEYEELVKACLRFIADRDGDGKRTPAVLNLFIPSDEKIAEIESDPKVEVNEALVRENLSTFNSNVVFGDYYICIIGEHLLDMKVTKDEKDNPFVKITNYLPEGADYVYGDKDTVHDGYVLCSDYGVYLHSTPLKDNPAFSELDKNTVIVMRKFSEVTSNFSTSKAEDYFRFCEDVLRKMLIDEAYE